MLTAELLTQSKQLELQLLDTQIKKDETLRKHREQELRDRQATPLSTVQKPPSSNHQPHGSKHPLGHEKNPTRLNNDENNIYTTISIMSSHASSHVEWDPV